MSYNLKNILASAAAATLLSASLVQAGGLSDAIVEREPTTIEPAAPAAVPGWVVPVVALLLIGAAVASGGDSDDDDSGSSERVTPTSTSGIAEPTK